jgi:hypothetical protein
MNEGEGRRTLEVLLYCGGESSNMSRAGTSNRSKGKIRNTQRREIVRTDIRELGPEATSLFVLK